jgi:hypothetical protein
VSKRTASTGHGSLATGAVTALALAVQTGLAAVVGVLIARELGRTAETDGFFASYGVFVVLALAATAIRVTILPPLARARDERRLSVETAAYAGAVAAAALPVALVGIVAAGPLAALLTGFGPEAARDAAATTLPWLVAAALGQLAAGVLASALAAMDDYLTPALGYICGSLAGLALILVRIGADGVEAVAWGMALNAAIATAVPALALGLRARTERMPAGAIRPRRGGTRRRLRELLAGAALPFSLQAIYLVCLPIAARGGVGDVTSLGYAYLIGAAIVAVAASSLGLVTSVPLTRSGIDGRRVAAHVDASSWLALLAIGVTAGIFAVAGSSIFRAVLGSSYGTEVGEEIGLLVVALAPWMVMAVGVSVTFPLVFVAGRGSRLPKIALAVILLHPPLAFAGQALAGLWGLAGALALSTALAFGWMLLLLDALVATLGELAVAAGTVAALVIVAFGVAALLLDDGAAALAGTAIFAAAVAVLRPPGLRSSWTYLRELA